MSYSSFLFAQASKDASDPTGSNVTWEWGLHAGNLLPNQIPGLTEITGLGGFRGGYRIADQGFIESGVATGSGNGASWTNLYASIRMEIPVETIVGLVFTGLDAIYYEGAGRDKKLFGGGHVGGGIQAQLGGSVWFRSDMKFTVNPGTSMYIDFGIMFRMP
ncbi:MAG: hypothetical protein KDD34_06330 [Bdellovibrionales bacterium]|nr:hypothetical protein [Bdellovibrionales bacterium]